MSGNYRQSETNVSFNSKFELIKVNNIEELCFETTDEQNSSAAAVTALIAGYSSTVVDLSS